MLVLSIILYEKSIAAPGFFFVFVGESPGGAAKDGSEAVIAPGENFLTSEWTSFLGIRACLRYFSFLAGRRHFWEKSRVTYMMMGTLEDGRADILRLSEDETRRERVLGAGCG